MHHQHFINAEQSGLYGAMILDYLKKKPGLREFYSHAPDIRSFADAINQKNKQPMDRALLAKVIAEQYKAIGLNSSHVESQITRLHNENTFTVCTGHQACLFTGPLYFIYKICISFFIK